MTIDWTVFEGRQYGRLASCEPRVTLDRRGVIYLNRVAYEALGTPGAVEMLFNHNGRILGLKPRRSAAEECLCGAAAREGGRDDAADRSIGPAASPQDEARQDDVVSGCGSRRQRRDDA